MDEKVQEQLLAEIIQDLEFEPSDQSMDQLNELISAFERAHGMSSEEMLKKFNCESFEEDPELGRWAALYYSFKELKESA